MDEWKPLPSTALNAGMPPPSLYRRKLKLKANLESSLTYFSFERLVPGAFNVSLIGSICTALPRAVAMAAAMAAVARAAAAAAAAKCSGAS